MRTNAKTLTGVLALLGLSLILACTASVSPGAGGGVVVAFTIGGKTFTINVFDNVGAFNVQPGAEPDRKAMMVRLFEQTPTDSPTEIDLTLDQDDVQVIPIDLTGQKISSVNAQGNVDGTATVNLYMAVGNSANPCAEGNQIATLDLKLENGQTVIYQSGQAVDVRAAVRLLEEQASLIRSGWLSLCFEVSSTDMAAQVIVNQLGVTVHALDEPSPSDNDNSANDNGGTVVDPGQVVTFPDPCLDDAVRNALNMDTGDITAADLAGLTSLTASKVGISNLSGLEYCTGLEYLSLNDNDIADLDAIGALPALKQLHLGNNLIVDLSPLAYLPAIEVLTLNANQISNLGPLQGLTTLLSLNVSYQLDTRIPEEIEDQQPPAFVYASHTVLSDLSPLDTLTSVTEFSLSGNAISNLEPLAELAQARILRLSYNQISDLSPLGDLPNLSSVQLNQNPIVDLSPLVGNADLGDTMTFSLNCCSPGFACGSATADPVQCGYIAELEARGVTVNAGYSDAETCATMPPILGLGSGSCLAQ